MRGLIIFDLDGTLYEGNAPYRFYAEVVARQMTSNDRHRYLGLVDRHLAASEAVVDGDNWEAMRLLAVPYLEDLDILREAYGETRAFMMSPDCRITVDPALRDFLESRPKHIALVCASNSPSQAALPLLERLDLHRRFDLVSADTQKPQGLIDLAERLWKGHPAPERTASVGDNYGNDIAPALAHGWFQAHISPRRYFPGPAAVQGRTIVEILPALRAWMAEILG